MEKDKSRSLTVVQHNDLIESRYGLELDEWRLITLALTKVNSKGSNIGVIDIYPDEFAEMYHLKKNNIWRNMKHAVLGIMERPIRIQALDSKGLPIERLINWLDEASYYVDQSDGSKIQIEFSRKVEPYIFDLSSNYTPVLFEFGGALNTIFSYRLYQWILLDIGRKRGSRCEFTMTLDDIKKRANITSYQRWANFHDRVLAPAVEAINQKTGLSVSFVRNIKGRSVHSITFVCINLMNALASGADVELGEVPPVRPRLLRRPHVTSGSHEEGEWQKGNLKILRQYQSDLKSFDSNAKLALRDLQKLIDYSRLLAPETHQNAILEMAARKRK